MRFDVITLFPEIIKGLDFGITGRAQKREQIAVHTWNPRDFTTHPDRRVDDRPYGGGPGMVMQYQPLHKAIQAAQAANNNEATVIYLSPQGKPFTQEAAQQFARTPTKPLIFLAGRYEGIDERLLEHDIDQEWSIGDFVLTGGELPAMTMIDAITRLLPDVLGDKNSAAQDSFSDGLLDCPHYTRPAIIDGYLVPEILQSGDHQLIADWRLQQSIKKTQEKRPDLLEKRPLTNKEKKILTARIQHKKEH